jgi:hypothetical protein
MATLSVHTPTKTGVAIGAAAASAGGDIFPNTGREFFYIKNAGVAACTVTFDAPGTCNFEVAANAAHDLVVVVAPDGEEIIGPFSQTRFNDSAGFVHVTYSEVTTVTVTLLAAASNA